MNTFRKTMNTFPADVVQFMLPNGKQTPQIIELSSEYEEKYKLMEECGCRLTAEILRTGEVSVCIEKPEHGDFDIKVIKNGPKVPKALEEMLSNFDIQQFNMWRCELE